ncbi:alpha/beta hydrolase [Geodermatophilus sp. FMUSA9-8]|uniref:alpha/beta hydrolase n=1 Tax=Geodermatophilus sp. FMUSA9-8 TaxID=3120155 RepID=UPI00300B7116
MSAPGLAAVAAWDTALLAGAVYTLEAVAERLPSWRARTDRVARSLTGAECWSGPAASVAGLALGEVSTVVTAVTGALDAALGRLRDTAREARTAQELAERALAAAAASGMALDASGAVVAPASAPPPAGATPEQLEDHYAGLAERAATAEWLAGLAAEAMAAAARAAAAAAASAEPLVPVGGTGPGPADFAGLAATVGATGAATSPPVLPRRGAAADEVASWWAGLSGPQQDALLDSDPAALGALDGLPAWARDRANRVVLDRVLAEGSWQQQASARAIAAEIAAEEADGQAVQLWVYDPALDRVALAYGDLDAAEDVGVLVPGVNTTVHGDLRQLGDDAQAVAAATVAAAPAATVATVAWLGYNPPVGAGLGRALTRAAATEGGAALAGDLAGLAASRAATGVGRAADPRVTVLAHSYGTVVLDEAGDLPGRLDADAVVLLGGPGIEEEHASGLEADEVYTAWSMWDPISWSGWFGENAWFEGFGATPLPTEPDTLHWEYHDADRPTLAAMGEVVAGVRESD